MHMHEINQMAGNLRETKTWARYLKVIMEVHAAKIVLNGIGKSKLIVSVVKFR